MRSIMDILLDDSDASIALSLAIAGVVARSTDAVSDSSRAVAASTGDVLLFFPGVFHRTQDVQLHRVALIAEAAPP